MSRAIRWLVDNITNCWQASPGFLGTGLGRLYGGLGGRQGFTVDLRQRHAERVIHAAGSARQHVDAFAGVRRRPSR